MTRTEFEKWLVSKGYKKNRYGHYSKCSNVRCKLSSRSVKIEIAYRDDENKLIWSRYRGNYYSKLSFTPDGKVSGMTRNALGILPRKVVPKENSVTDEANRINRD